MIAGALIGCLGTAAVVHLLRGQPPAAVAASTNADRNVPYLDGNLIRFSDSFAKRASLSSAVVGDRQLSPTVNVTGTVTWDTRRFAAVGARIPGRVRTVHKVMGDDVKAGEALAEIESAELGRAEAAVLAARAKEIAAEADMKREADLAAARVSSQRDAEFAKAAYEAARAERLAAERTVQALGGDPNQQQLGLLRLRAPVAGRIVSAQLARGQTVDATTTLYEIADRGAVWVELQVFERDIRSIRPGDAVEISTSSSK
ncbi:MAG TPA: efflux RND transporter periplasmic adaptor subunit, partial [Polyangia bacterium]